MQELHTGPSDFHIIGYYVNKGRVKLSSPQNWARAKPRPVKARTWIQAYTKARTQAEAQPKSSPRLRPAPRLIPTKAFSKGALTSTGTDVRSSRYTDSSGSTASVQKAQRTALIGIVAKQ